MNLLAYLTVCLMYCVLGIYLEAEAIITEPWAWATYGYLFGTITTLCLISLCGISLSNNKGDTK